jgi:hypothetical protein
MPRPRSRRSQQSDADSKRYNASHLAQNTWSADSQTPRLRRAAKPEAERVVVSGVLRSTSGSPEIYRSGQSRSGYEAAASQHVWGAVLAHLPGLERTLEFLPVAVPVLGERRGDDYARARPTLGEAGDLPIVVGMDDGDVVVDNA